MSVNTQKSPTGYKLTWIVALCMVLEPAVALAQGLTLKSSDEGKALYERHCALCHGLDGKGNGAMADRLIRTPSDLTKLSIRNDGVFPYDYVAERIDGRKEVAEHGLREMPIWGERFGTGAKAEEDSSALTAIIDHLKSIQANNDR